MRHTRHGVVSLYFSSLFVRHIIITTSATTIATSKNTYLLYIDLTNLFIPLFPLPSSPPFFSFFRHFILFRHRLPLHNNRRIDLHFYPHDLYLVLSFNLNLLVLISFPVFLHFYLSASFITYPSLSFFLSSYLFFSYPSPFLCLSLSLALSHVISSFPLCKLLVR